MSDEFDFNEALEALQSGQPMSGKDGEIKGSDPLILLPTQ